MGDEMHFVWHTIYAIASVRLGRYMIYLMVGLKHHDFWPLLKISSSWVTGKSLSEALIFALTNPQYDDRLFIELQVQYMKIPSSNLGTSCCVQKLFPAFRTIFVCNMFSPCSAKRRASDKDLPVLIVQFYDIVAIVKRRGQAVSSLFACNNNIKVNIGI